MTKAEESARIAALEERVAVLTEALRVLLSAPVNAAISKEEHTKLLEVRGKLV